MSEHWDEAIENDDLDQDEGFESDEDDMEKYFKDGE